MAFISCLATSSKEWQLQLKRMVLQGAPRVVPSVVSFFLRGFCKVLVIKRSSGFSQGFIKNHPNRGRQIKRAHRIRTHRDAVEPLTVAAMKALGKARRLTAENQVAVGHK